MRYGDEDEGAVVVPDSIIERVNDRPVDPPGIGQDFIFLIVDKDQVASPCIGVLSEDPAFGDAGGALF